MSKQKTFPNLIIILLALCVVSCDINLSSGNPDNGSDNNPGTSPGNGVTPTPSLALRAVPVAASSSSPKVLDSYTDGSKNYYLIDVGNIRNTYVSDVVAPVHYNGITPMSLSKTTIAETTVAEAMKNTVANSITISDSQNHKVGIEAGYDTKIPLLGFSVKLKYEWSGTWTNSNTTTRSTETSITETRRYSESLSISFTIGNHGEPAGYYRYSIYAIADIYFLLSTSLDNQELLSWDTVACARVASFLPHLDYEVDGNFDNSPAGNDITFTDDFYKNLQKPTAGPSNINKQTQVFDLTKSAVSALIAADTDIAIIIGDSSKTYSGLEIITAERSTPLTIELQNVSIVGPNGILGTGSDYIPGTPGKPVISMGSNMSRVPDLTIISNGGSNLIQGGKGGNGSHTRTGGNGGAGASAVMADKITITGNANIVLCGGNGGNGGDGIANWLGHCDGGNGGNGGASINANDITISLHGIVYAIKGIGGYGGASGPIWGTPGSKGSDGVQFTSTPRILDGLVRDQQ
jgi:hypothetical protein